VPNDYTLADATCSVSSSSGVASTIISGCLIIEDEYTITITNPFGTTNSFNKGGGSFSFTLAQTFENIISEKYTEDWTVNTYA